VFDDDECYPDPDEIAAELRERMGIDVVVVPRFADVQEHDLVHVISGETECNRVVLAIRSGPKGRLFVLDSDFGPVYVKGATGLSEATKAAAAGPLREMTAASKLVAMHRADEKARFEVHCPDGTTPVGGGWVNAEPIGSDGEGLYPHSYERLGVQGGFHVTSVYVDRSRPDTPTRRAEIQVVCGRGLVPADSPHETTFIQHGSSGSVTAECPEGTEIFSGGFQRTNFITPDVVTAGVMYGGDYVTESRIDGNGWRVSGGAANRYGGELTAIAYCADDPSLPVEEVSASVEVNDGKAATATTPSCPEGRVLIAGGFSFGDSTNALFPDGYFTRNGTWSATGYGWFGSAELTAYGYCAEARDTVDRGDFPKEPPPGPPVESGGGHTVLYVVFGVLGLIVIGLFLRRRQVVRRRARRRRAAGASRRR
jgi:hypothetical protein